MPSRRRFFRNLLNIEQMEPRLFLSTTPPSFHADINFQPASSPIPSGYLVDSGAKYGSRGNGYTYGWSTNISASTRDRNSKLSPDQQHDTLIAFQSPTLATWEIAVPNGTYNIDIVAGDPAYTDSTDKINVEGTLMINGKPTTSKLWLEGVGSVTVSDGKLTVSAASGAANDKIDYIKIDLVPPKLTTPPSVTTPPPVTDPPPTDPPPVDPTVETVQLTAPDASVSEANLDPGDFLFTRTGPTDQDLTVNYLVSGTATANVDYVALSGSVVIPAGQTTADVPLTPIDDSHLEPSESVTLQLAAGNYTIGASQSATITITSNDTSATEQPFYGTPQVFSATIQAEDFDQGPSGTAYADKTPGNSGGVYRATDIDIAPTTDIGGGFAVVNLQQDEWMRYTIDVPVTGIYRIETRVASNVGASIFHISFDGVSTGSQTIPNTGGLENWTTLVKTATLTAGVHVMKFYVDTAKTTTTNVGSLNYIRVYRDLSATSNAVAFTAAPSLPSARQESMSAALNGDDYVFGGFTKDSGGNLIASSEVDRYDPTSDTWTTLGDMPEAITHAAVVAISTTQAWLIGGYVGNDPGPATTHVWIYDSSTDTWTVGPDLPHARGAGAAAMIGGVIHFVGGRDGARDADEADHFAYDLNNPNLGWQTLAALPTARNNLAAEVVNGKLYALLGQQMDDGSAIPQSEVDVYDPASDSWSQAASAPLALSNIAQATVVYGGKIITIGGDLSNNVPSDQVLMYDPSTNLWSILGHLPSTRGAVTVQAIGRELIVAGGFSTTGPSATTWIAKLWSLPGQLTSFSPGAVWDDTAGNPIQAHGGDIFYQNGVYYWYGENKDAPTTIENNEPRVDVIGISVYTSTDLYNWTYQGLALPGQPTGDLAPQNVLERPKVIYNASTGKYVMWMHVDSADYSKASVGVAVADSPLGPFVYQGSFQPLGMDSRDETIFQDTDGTAYLVFATNHNKQICIAQMTSDYLGLTGVSSQPYTTTTQREAPELFKHDGEYFLITSGATWFAPNAAMYAVSSTPMGAYTIEGNPASGSQASTTYDSQGAFVFQIAGTDNFIFMADRWNALDLGSSTYVWLPMRFSGTTLSIDAPTTWDLSTFH